MRRVNCHIFKAGHYWLTGPLILFAALFVSPLQAGKAVDRLNSFFSAKGALRADFVQIVQGAAFSQPKESGGILMMQRPGKFRWDYQTPYQQLILADGKRLWIFDQDLDQVVVKPLDVALGDTPALLLSGQGMGNSSDGSTLQQRFVITELDKTRDGLFWVQLIPKATDSNFQEMRLGFGEKYISKMELVDGFGQRTELIFNNVKMNAKLPVDSFVFVPPKGVDVIGNPDAENKAENRENK